MKASGKDVGGQSQRPARDGHDPHEQEDCLVTCRSWRGMPRARAACRACSVLNRLRLCQTGRTGHLPGPRGGMLWIQHVCH